ncbi:MAG: VanZ family protein [Clostridia bacterium]|nr:VanZ family protein [Clostridia bacterium]
MDKKKAIHSIFFWALIAVIGMTVIFIFSNSLIPPEESGKLTGEIGEVISGVIPPESGIGSFISKYVGKVAHFSEYGLLGIEVAVFVYFYLQKCYKWGPLSLFGAMLVALIDETIQYIPGRTASVFDVWLDVGGFAFFSIITYALLYLSAYIVRRLRSKREDTEN